MDPFLWLIIGVVILIGTVVGVVVFFLTKSSFYAKGYDVGRGEGYERGKIDGAGLPASISRLKPGIYPVKWTWQLGKNLCFATVDEFPGGGIILRTWSFQDLHFAGSFYTAEWIRWDGHQDLVFSETKLLPVPPPNKVTQMVPESDLAPQAVEAI